MDFFDMVQKLQIIYGMKIVLISCGSFYITIGTDAVVLNKKLGLKLNCAKRGMCKVGIPKGSLEKYKQKLDELGSLKKWIYVFLVEQLKVNLILNL